MSEKNGLKNNNEVCEQFHATSEVYLEYLKEKVLEAAGLSEIFKVLGDESRTKILYLLAQQPLCVCEIATIMGMTLPAISHHLRLLKALRLVKHNRNGKLVYYSLDDQHILNLIREAQAHFAEADK